MNESSSPKSAKVKEIERIIRDFEEIESMIAEYIPDDEKERWFKRKAYFIAEKFYFDEMLKATEDDMIYMAAEVLLKLAHDTSETLSIAIENGVFDDEQ